MTKHMQFFEASTTPMQDIEKVTYKGQDPKRRMYHIGFEDYLNQMPILNQNDQLLESKVELSNSVMEDLGKELLRKCWIYEDFPESFDRTILAIESPQIGSVFGDFRNGSEYVQKEGVELIMARWGDGFTSPVHGHAYGYINEKLLFGKMLITTYRLMEDGMVRPLEIKEFEGNVDLISTFKKGDGNKRENYIHSFTSIGESASLHYVPEHTRDGRDNQFQVDWFDNAFCLTSNHVKRITSQEGMYLQNGEVVLVRSENVPEFGDHYIVVTGRPIMKPHGLRIQDVIIPAPQNKLLNSYEKMNGLTLLKLDAKSRDAFHKFHGITLEGNTVNPKVIFSKP